MVYQLYTEAGGIIPATNSASITVFEGAITIAEVLTTTANGQGGQRYTLSSANVVDKSVQVKVYEDGVTLTNYQHVARIATANTGDRVFVTSVTADGDTEVIFGTIINGFIPPTGSKVTATYASSSGESGNLPANSVVGYKASPPADVKTTTSSSMSGGLNEESIASLKRSIPSVISAQNRAVTRNDFVALSLQVDGVAKAAVSFGPSTAGPSAGNASVTIFPQAQRSDYLTTTDLSQAVTATMQTAVISAIQPRALLGVNVYCASTITWTKIDVKPTIYVNEKYVATWVKRDVENALNQLFEFDNVFFGQRIALGQVYRIILNVPGVDYCTIETFALAGVTALNTSILVGATALPKKGTFVLTMVGGVSTS